MKTLQFTLILFLIVVSHINGQMNGLHGDISELRRGVHDGNQFRLSFFNDGTYGTIMPYELGLEYRGEWPINSGHLYLIDGNIFVGSEVLDNNNNFIRIISENISVNIGGSRGDQDPLTGAWWTFLPLPGFANPDQNLIAMSHQPNTWPAYWPDIADPDNPRYSADGWAGHWNSYFGKGVIKAERESYFVFDDYNNSEFNFSPDTNDTDRKGLGIRGYARGLQWNYPALEDILFLMFEFENIGTYNHQKMVFAYKFGNNMGDDENTFGGGNDWADYIAEHDMAYMWEGGCHPQNELDPGGDCIAPGGWAPVGFIGGAFLESPGHPYDGIDNDNDGSTGSGITINETMFQPQILTANSILVLINYNTFERKLITLEDTLANLGSDELLISNGILSFTVSIGDTVLEIGDNGLDDNLNGLIDENKRAFNEEGAFLHYFYLNHKAINYITGNGLDNPLIDESQDDGIDNNGNWDVSLDDIGADGLGPGDENYPGPDQGEGDGIPTRGEPHFESFDAGESDLLGLTSTAFYEWTNYNQYDDNAYWTIITPGMTMIPLAAANAELVFGTGYFPLKPAAKTRATVAIIMGENYNDLLATKEGVDLIYNNNFALPIAPKAPNLTAVKENNRITLNWDNLAETFEDPINGIDFEGYMLYKSTDNNELGDLILQVDIDNDYSGFSTVPGSEEFFLGNNSGIQNSYVDDNVQNGIYYYYTLFSYDHGNPDMNINPRRSVVVHNKNFITARPVSSGSGAVFVEHIQGLSSGNIVVEVIDTTIVESDHEYQITFNDSMVQNTFKTIGFSLTDITENNVIADNINLFSNPSGYHLIEGFGITLQNTSDGEVKVIEENSGWNDQPIVPYVFTKYSFREQPVSLINGDFQIIFGEVGIDTSRNYYRGTTLEPAIPVNFKIINTLNNEKINFAFRERYIDETGIQGKFNINFANRQSDEIIMLTDATSQIASWWVRIDAPVLDGLRNPEAGDTLRINLTKPFLANDIYSFTPIVITDINDRMENPVNFHLYQNYPNPFNPRTTIKFDLPHSIRVNLTVYNVMGQRVATLLNSLKSAGAHKVEWDASYLSSGIYFYRIQAGSFSEVKRMVLIK
jgi:hypothetical protein